MLRNKKGEEIAINKIIVIIMVVIVILAVLTFLFKANLLNYIKNLPDYQSPDEDKEIIPSNDTSANSQLCNGEIIGKITSKDLEVSFLHSWVASSGAYIHIKQDNAYSKTNLLWVVNKGYIELDGSGTFSDETIGSVSADKVILIDSKWMNDESLRKEYSKYLPSVEVLNKLNGAKFISGNNICREIK